MNVELVAVAVMSVDLLQLGLVQGLVPGLVQVVAHLVHVVLGQGGAIQRVLGIITPVQSFRNKISFLH